MVQLKTNYSSHNDDMVSAHITIQKNRLRCKAGKVYLKDGTDFEIELINRKSHYVAARICINGDYIGSDIILNPHNTVYLERHIGTPKKFRFNSFMTANDDKLNEIVAKNGLIEISFYDEIVPVVTTYTTTTFPSYYFNNSLWNPNGTCALPNNMVFYSSAHDGNDEMLCDSYSPTNKGNNYKGFSGKMSAPEIETGRVEKGDNSNQKFVNVSAKFYTYPFETDIIHILPISRQENDINVISVDDIRSYCPKCGRRIKKGWKFCAGCGTEF